MRVNPYYINSAVTALDNAQSLESQLTSELSSGVRVNKLSDDPTAAGQNVQLLNQIQLDDTFTQTASLAQGQLQVADTTLGSVISQLNTAISLITEGNTGTENASDRSSIADQLTGIRNEILSLGNTSYMGQYIFAGSQSSTQPFSLDTSTTPATVVYSGDNITSSIVTPNGQSIQMNLAGSAIFGSGSTGVIAVLNQAISDFQAGNTTSLTNITGALSSVSQQRVVLDNSLSRLTAADSAVSSEKTQLTTEQTNLMQADVATISTNLSTAEAQVTALSSVIAQLDKGSLFDYVK